ncbi:hypothetical protein ACFWXO_21855 [Kitasatospora sp. NPDC059088]|uniref:hypothetical protein n=1 Tax=Kitasatospora sp. NPDC059088 TaxID=3346722 RepID=UPI0036A6BDD4
MSVGPTTSILLKAAKVARRQRITASYSAVTQACVDTGDTADGAELVSEHPDLHRWSLPASDAVAMVHTSLDEAWALLRGAQLLEQQPVPVVRPHYRHVRTHGARAVTFWHQPGRRHGDPAVSAWVTAAVHSIHPKSALWLEPHDPFDGLLDALADADVDEAGQWFLREHAARLREEWERIVWPTPPTVILGDTRTAACYDDGRCPRLLLRRPLRLGRREWDLVAARWRTELLRGHPVDLHAYTSAYTSRARPDLVPYDQIGAWPDYQTVRDVVVLTAVMETVRRSHLYGTARQRAAHQIACLRGAHQLPWNWGQR